MAVSEACGATLVSLFGLTTDLDGQTCLVALASTGPAAAALPIGEMLTLPGPESQDGSLAPMAVPPWAPPASLLAAASCSTTAKQLHPTAKPGGVPDGDHPAAAATAIGDLYLLCDSAWQRVTSSLRSYCPPEGPRRWHVVLTPLRLGHDLAGAMLLVLPGQEPGGQAEGPGSRATGGKLGGTGSVSSTSGRVLGPLGGPRGPLWEGVVSDAAVLEALSACVAECCLGPVLASVNQVCASCGLVDSSCSLHDLSASLTSALTSALSAELHVDLGVRLAILPCSTAQYGVLFDEAAAAAAKGRPAGGGGASSVSGRLHRSASASLANVTHGGGGGSLTAAGLRPALASPQISIRTAGVGAGATPLGMQLEAGRSCGPASPGLRQQGGGLPGVAAGGSTGVAGARVNQLQAAATRAAAQHSGPLTAEDYFELPTRDPCSVTEGFTGALGLGCGRSSVGGRGRGNPKVPLLSPQQGPGGRAQTKASTFCLSSTLAATLLASFGATGGFSSASGSLPTAAATLSVASPATRTSGGSTISAATGGGPCGGQALRLSGAVVANVSSYLHDAEQPSADVFMVFKRSGTASGPASLVTVAAWWPATAAAAAGGGAAGRGGGGRRDSLRVDGSPAVSQAIAIPGGAAFLDDNESTPPPQQSQQQPRQGAKGRLATAHGGGGVTISMPSSVGHIGSGAGAGAGGSLSPPAFVVYLTSALPLPQQLLGAVRNRATALLEALVPAAARALAGAVQDEWSYLCSQVGGAGTLSGVGPADDAGVGVGSFRDSGVNMSSTGRSNVGGRTPPLAASRGLPSPANTDRVLGSGRQQRSTASGMGPGESKFGPAQSNRNLASGPSGINLAAATTTTTTSRAVQSPAASGSTTRFGRDSVGTIDLAAARPADGHHLLLSPYGSEEVAGGVGGAPPALRSPRGGGGGANISTGAPAGCSSSGASGRQPRALELACRAVGTDPITPNPPKTQHPSNQQPVDTAALLSTGLLALVEEEPAAAAASSRGTGGGCSTPPASGIVGGENGGFLTTVLSDARGAAKEARQQQLDIMVSTFHTALNRAKHEAGVLGGAHAEDDVRSLRLIRTLGHGGCSVVMLARLHAMPVAVKVILPPEEEGEEGEGERGGGEDGQQQGPQLQVLSGPAAPDAPSNDSSMVLFSDRTNTRTPQQANGSTGGGWSRPSPTARQLQLRVLLRGARELAVMTSISHPNIVQVYSFCTRVTIKEGTSGVPQLVVVPEGVALTEQLCTALIMEYCDMGSLADAIDTGTFARAMKTAAAALSSKSRSAQSVAMGRVDRANLPGCHVGGAAGGVAPPSALAMSGSLGKVGATDPSQPRSGQLATTASVAAATAGGPMMRAIYLTLLEVALALRHLHAMQLVHCDVKPANVLLRSSATDPRGFTAKLTDFGFVSLIEHQRQRSRSEGGLGDGGDGDCRSLGSAGRTALKPHDPVGTVTHMAPELFIKGNLVDSSLDIYAFGIVMWELSTGRAPYTEYAEGHFVDVPYKVVKEGLRPRFPPDTPLHFKLLAQECWSSQPSRRPTAAALVSRLQHLLDISCGAGQQAGPL